MRGVGAAVVAAGAVLLAAGCRGRGDAGWGHAGLPPGGRAGATDAGGDTTQRDARAGLPGSLLVVQGTIVRSAPDAVQVASDLGGRRTLRIGPTTALVREDQRIPPDELRPGVEVRASFREAGATPEPEAIAIEVLPHRGRLQMNGVDTSTLSNPHGGGAHGAQGGEPGEPGGANAGAPSPYAPR